MKAKKKDGDSNAPSVGDAMDMKGVMKMLGGFTVLRMTSMIGMVGISITKEELLKLNKKLNRIRKPKDIQ